MRLLSLGRQMAFATVCIAFIAVLIGTSESFGHCITGSKHLQAYRALHEAGSLFVKTVSRTELNIACARVTVGQNDGAVTALGTIVLAGFTFALWVSTHRLWIAGERQAEFSRILAEAAILAQRARIQITPSFETDRPPDWYALGVIPPAPQFKFAAKMDNVGQIPAANLKNRIDYVLAESQLSDDFNFPDDPSHLSQSGVLGRQQFLLSPHVPPSRYISAAEIERMRVGELWFYLYGWVTYSDGVSHTPRRTTRFCYLVRVTGNRELPVVFIPHGRNNYSD